MTSYELRVTDADIGRSVLYHPRSGAKPEQGIIAGQNESYVFVLFLNESKPCIIHRLMLEYTVEC